MLASPTNSSERKSSDQSLNRACEACRLSKVRCLVNPGSDSSQCQRCAKAGRQCVFAPPAKRRQRKRTDVRVAELEKEVKQLHSLLKPNTAISPVEASEDSMNEDEEQPTPPEKDSFTYVQSHDSNVGPEPTTTRDFSSKEYDTWMSRVSADMRPSQDPLAHLDDDMIDRGIISKELAEELLNIYRDELVGEYPCIMIPRDWTVEQLRTRKPALFCAVMAAASHSKGVALSNKLNQEVIYLYARLLFIEGEKSLSYIQALFVTVSYYTPPNIPARMQIYQYGNIAASMALELGLASKPRTHEQLPKRAVKSFQKISTPEELLENCRTVLCLYTLTAGFGLRLRRPNILLWNSWLEESQALLSKSPILEDKIIVAWLRLQRIADETNTAFGFDDASTSFSLSELRLQTILRIFERRMQDWKRSIPADVMSLSLMMEYNQNLMSMWDFAMDGGRYDAPEFRNRLMTLPALDDDCVQPETLLSRSALQVHATVMCISAAQSILDCFLQISPEKLQTVPGVVFVRAIFALVSLLKADYAVGTDSEGMGEVLDSKSLKVDYYLDSVLRLTTEAIGPQKCIIPSHWLFVLKQKLKAWHDEHQQWRRDGGHSGRKTKVRQNDAGIPRAEVQPPTYTPEETPPAHSAPNPSLVLGDPNPQARPPQQSVPQQPLPEFNLNSSYQWPTTNTNFTPDNNQGMADAFGPDMTDFSAAFSNGDLYLWNDLADNFGGWVPSGGAMYNDTQFGMGGQGM